MPDRQVYEWLARLGLAQYAETFANNAIDWDVLADLNDDDLRLMEIPLGHRRKLLRAITALSAGAPTAAREEAPHPQWIVPVGGNLSYAAPAGPDRRQLTVMFCDLVDSTALSGRLDPEDMLDVLQRYQHVCASSIAEFGGAVAQYLGDGVLAFFGYPRAHEDDAERAVRAALSIIDAIGPLNAALDGRMQVTVAVRIGIATGRVVVGNIIGEAGAEQRTAIGEPPNRAARLQRIAQPNTVVIADATHHLLGGRFEYEDLGWRSLNGFDEPERAWRVVRPAGTRRRLDSARDRPKSPFIGRQLELRHLGDAWRRARDGSGRVVLLSGEPGIGKSRLGLAFEEQIDGEPHAVLQFCCSPFHRNSALYPVIDQIARAAEFGEPEDETTRLTKLRALLGDHPDAAAMLPLLAALFGIDGGSEEAPPVSARKRKQLTLEALLSWIEHAARAQPLLLRFDDLQWIDPTSGEFLDLLVDRAAGLPILIVGTARPEYSAPWQDRSHVSVLSIKRLDRRRTAEFIEKLVDGKGLPEAVLNQIVTKTGGVPLFVEELTRTVLDSGLMRAEGDRFVIDGPLPQRAIPATIQDSLMARLDQLALPKEIAQVGSVIGRRFSFELLATVTELPEPVLRESLARLVASDLVFCRGTPPHAVYVFKHALVQDTAYESLLISKRRALHRQIARVLVERFGETARTAPEEIAHHFTEAGDAEPAAEFWLQAADRASGASAFQEAANHLQRGLAAIETLPEGPRRDTLELRLRLPLGIALIALKGGGSPEVERVYARCLDLCGRLPESPLHFPAFWGWWRISMDFRTGRDRADQLLALATRLDDAGLLLQSHHALWASSFMLGDHRACLQHVDHGLALYDVERHAALSSIYAGHDPRVCGDGEAALSLWLTGHAEQAELRSAAAYDWARQLGHAGSVAHALDYMVVLNRYRRRPAEVGRLADEMIRFAEDRGLPDYIGKGRLFRGWAQAMLGGGDAGVRDLLDGLSAQRESGTPEDFPVYYDMLAEALLSCRRFDEALVAVDEALALGARSGICYWDAELYRRRAELLLAGGHGDPSIAEMCLRHAFATARQQGARMLELRAATDLSRLLQRQRQPVAARELLLPVFGWFSGEAEGDEVRAARELVTELT